MARFVAGQKVRASELNDATALVQALMNNTEQTITTTVADISNASVTVETVAANVDLLVLATFDVTINGGTDVFVGALYLDGNAQSGQALVQGSGRWTVSQHWKIGISTPGSHTLKLRGSKVNNSNVVKCSEIHTRITVMGAST